ncbi:MAG TPA: tRNA (adenosine(37)-N6)-threonylcarbamoyltransferase complex ATPase subunit type 1 TsaE [Candidatus Limnocylindria bacterium]|nr:tRNA (adenosine(37)-N6)-threonylcarbamoyltransferase complex ATPase subunit type 1 TsaE [Candidatus Limnocylindria bacterium]
MRNPAPLPVPSVAGRLSSTAPAETREVGRALARRAAAGTVIALVGPLGAGKTELTKGIADGLGVRGVVNSPTFVLMNEHPGRLRLFHADLYRLGDPAEVLSAGLLDERAAYGVTVIEWAERLGDWLPAERLEIWIEPAVDGSDRRLLRWAAHGPAHIGLAAEAFGR